jgi:hypothetical protein
MGKAVFISIIIIHGLIHLMGFAKSFGLLRITELSQDISKPLGLLWLLSAILFFSVGILYLSNKDWWWIPGIFAIILSLFLIVVFWQDAKFGIIPNIIILAAVVIGFALWNFDNQVDEEIKRILAVNNREAQVITEDMIQEMPDPVQRWLRNSGVIGKEKIHTVYLRQKGSMRLKPEQKGWMKADAEQYFTIDKPAFVWRVRTPVMGLPVVGRDIFRDGKGGMQIKLAGIVPVVNLADNPKLNEATLQRYLGEMIWFPTAALSENIKWEPIDDYKAKATMSIGETTGSAIFYFNDEGELSRFVAYRYRDISDPEPTEWVAKIKEYRYVKGIKIPSKLEASWMLDQGEFTWYRFDVYEVKYNELE